jgi:uncharacterized protein YkwD
LSHEITPERKTMRRRTILSIGLAGLAVGIGPAAWARQTHGGDASCDAAIRLLSAARREAGLAPLALEPALTETARRQALHMAGMEQTSHLGPNGEDPPLRAWQAGYGGHVLGENLAETYHGAAETMAFWLQHPSTRDVLMDPEARSFGLSVVEGRDTRLWWDLVTGV